MLNYIWLGLILAAVVIAGATDRMDEVTKGAFDASRFAVMNLALPLAGIMALWLGVMRLAEKSGLVYLIAAGIRPVLRLLFPQIPANHPAMGAMVLNIAANMLGLGNAATPFGIKAMKHLDALNSNPGVATNAMCTFLAINTSSVQIIPATIVGIMAAAGSVMPTAIIPTALIATTCSTIAAIIAVKLLERMPIFRRDEPPPMPRMDHPSREETKVGDVETPPDESPDLQKPKGLPLWGRLIVTIYFAFFFMLFLGYLFPAISLFAFEVDEETHILPRAIEAMAVLAIPFAISFFALYAALSGVKVYEEFVEGAKEGFQIAVRIIPYIVAIMVAIGMFREAEGIELLSRMIEPALAFIRFPVELLPIAIMRPLSGSGALGLLGDLVAVHGPDSFIARAGATIAGSTETTFYVLAVYFGAVGVRRTRHALPAGLFADIVGIVAAVTIATIVFGR